MEIAVTTTSDAVAIVVVLAPVVAAFGSIWIKGGLDRRAEHRSARRQAYAEFISATRIVAIRSTRYQSERSAIGAFVASLEDSGPLIFGLILLTLKQLRRTTTAAERVGLLGLLGSARPSFPRVNESRLYDAIEDLQLVVSTVRIVGSEPVIAASDDVLSVSKRILEAAARTYGFKQSRFVSALKGLADELDEVLNQFVAVARKEFPGL
jgi:hypothetical protein